MASTLQPDPFVRFADLFRQASQLDRNCFPDPNAMTLATVGEDGAPSCRVVLLKEFDARGFVFYTNFQGRKGVDLVGDPRAALCFHWPPLGQQVRVEGNAVPVSDAEADGYFATRPRESQLGAWASLQSSVIAHPGDLEARLAAVTAEHAGRPVPRPPYWSGFRIVPHRIEFWENRPSRLHVRHLYTNGPTGWEVVVLYP